MSKSKKEKVMLRVSLLDACREMARRMGCETYYKFPQRSKGLMIQISDRHHPCGWLATGDGAFEILAWLRDQSTQIILAFDKSCWAWKSPTLIEPEDILQAALTATDAEGREWRIEG